MQRVGYDCDVWNKMCVQQPGGMGTYTTLADCQASCGPKCWFPQTEDNVEMYYGPNVEGQSYFDVSRSSMHPRRIVGDFCTKQLIPYEVLERHPNACGMTEQQCNNTFYPRERHLARHVRGGMHPMEAMGTMGAMRNDNSKSTLYKLPFEEVSDFGTFGSNDNVSFPSCNPCVYNTVPCYATEKECNQCADYGCCTQSNQGSNGCRWCNTCETIRG